MIRTEKCDSLNEDLKLFFIYSIVNVKIKITGEDIISFDIGVTDQDTDSGYFCIMTTKHFLNINIIYIYIHVCIIYMVASKDDYFLPEL